MTATDTQRERRAIRLAQAICPVCGEEPTAGRKRCARCLEAQRARSKAYQEKHPTARRKHYLKSVFGITLEDYQRMWDEQEGLCAICGKPSAGERPLGVDHCHETGRVRGLLCNACNSMLGRLDEDPSKIVAYLAKHKVSL